MCSASISQIAFFSSSLAQQQLQQNFSCFSLNTNNKLIANRAPEHHTMARTEFIYEIANAMLKITHKLFHPRDQSFYRYGKSINMPPFRVFPNQFYSTNTNPSFSRFLFSDSIEIAILFCLFSSSLHHICRFTLDHMKKVKI